METNREAEKTEQYITTSEAAQHLRFHDETIRRWITRDGCPALPAGGSWRLRLSEIEAWLRQRGQGRRRFVRREEGA